MRNDAQIVTDANRRVAQRTVRSDAEIVANANWRATQRVARSDAQIAADVNRRATQRATRSDALIASENAACANARMLLHFDRQQEMRNTDRHAHQGQREQLPKKRHQEIRNVDRQARSAQREFDRANQGGNQVIPLACREFDGNHCGFCHTLVKMTTVCGKCDALHFLEERAASSSCTNQQLTLCCA
jgi:hypothetical protein